MSSAVHFCIDWYAGPSTQVELFSPAYGGTANVYQLKYTPPFRSTIRPPLEQRPLGSGELDPITQQLDQLVQVFQSRGRTKTDTAGDTLDANLDTVTMVGTQLLDLALPQYVKADLRINNLFVEIGLDEGLLHFPWELMHDGDDFLCLKHYCGRFVNALATGIIPSQKVSPTQVGTRLEELSILVISVPSPQPRKNNQGKDCNFEKLDEAEAETKAIGDILTGRSGVKLNVLIGRDATYNEVWKALRKGGPYQIVHFNGHAYFDADNPKLSSLVLYDKDMSTGPIVSYMGQQSPPTFCFVNACQTTQTATWKESQSVFGLARALLETGSYFLGSRWPLNDKSAAIFAKTFYIKLLEEQTSLGQAIQEARQACKASSPPYDLAWASYSFYGDPRLCFRLV